jgi:Xaa-Pro aminopeptidase
MTKKELDWLDSYHQEVYDKVSPLLEEESSALVWLKKATSPIERS